MLVKKVLERPLTEFGKQVKIALIQKGMLQKDLAEKLGINYLYLIDIMRGMKPGHTLKPKIAEILEFKYEEERN